MARGEIRTVAFSEGVEVDPGELVPGSQRVLVTDTTGWDGASTQVVYDVTDEVDDARYCIWQLKANGSAFLQIEAEITATATAVTVTVGIPLAAGTYTLLGVG